MNDAALHSVSVPELPFDEVEILRYTQIPRNAPVPEALPLAACLEAVQGKVRCRAVWREFPIHREADGLDLGFAKTESRNLAHRLEGCDRILLFACTAGHEMDRLIARESLRSPVHGLVMHAVGAERAESACDWLCARFAEAYPDCLLTERYSPGFGDLPLELQREVIRALDCEKTLGVTLTPSLLMRPAKTVTAIVGLKERT